MSGSVWSQCRVQELSQSPSKDTRAVHMLGYRLNARPPSLPSLPAFQGKGSSDGCPARSLPWGSGQVPSSSLSSKYKFSHQDHAQAWTPRCKSGALPAEQPRGLFAWYTVSQESPTTLSGDSLVGQTHYGFYPRVSCLQETNDTI